MSLLKMYSLLKMEIFHCYVSFLEGILFVPLNLGKSINSLKTNEFPLKINGWFRCIPYWNSPFLGDMLVFGGVTMFNMDLTHTFPYYWKRSTNAPCTIPGIIWRVKSCPSWLKVIVLHLPIGNYIHWWKCHPWHTGKLNWLREYWEYNWVVVLEIFHFHPYLGKIPILTNIFQRGWNHQLDKPNLSPLSRWMKDWDVNSFLKFPVSPARHEKNAVKRCELGGHETRPMMRVPRWLAVFWAPVGSQAISIR